MTAGRAGGLVAVVLLAAACGTTVPAGSQSLSSGGQPGSAGQFELGGPAATGTDSGTLENTNTTGGSANGGPVTSSDRSGTAGEAGRPAASQQLPGAPSAGGGGGGSAGAVAHNGFGVTSTTISVAAVYPKGAGAGSEALGASGLDPGDTRAAQQAVADYINKNGGVAGRKLRLVWHEVDSARPRSENEQAACAAFTEDDQVFVLGAGTEITNECARRNNALGLTNGIMSQTSATLRKYPSIIQITGFTVDRAMRVTVNGLARQKYFTPTAKVGVVTWDGSDYRYGVTHGALPALAAAGVKAEVIEIPVPEAYGNLGPTSAAISNAVLKFRSAGVTHVIIMDGAAGTIGPGYLVLEWMHNAESQQWRPTYGLNSNSGFSTMAPNLPPQQMSGSLGVGWVPIADQTPDDQQSWLKTSQAQLCLKIMKDAGQPSSTNNQKTLQFYYCDFFFFLKHSLDRVSGPLNLSTAMAAVNSVGSSYPVLSTFGTEITADKHDGATLARTMQFFSDCTCYRYTSAPQRME